MNKVISDQYDWDELMDFIAEGNLTPVIGKELYKFKDGNELVPIDDYLSKKIFELYKVTDYKALSLTDAVSYLENEKKIKSMDIIRRLKIILKESNFDFPLLSDFLKINALKYYVNTTVYNSILEAKISEIQNSSVNSINFSINEPFSDCEDLAKLTEAFVFNVFGSLIETNDPALSEEDMLEYAGYFREKMSNAGNLVNALQNKNLLFIGCSYPEWMVRFALRLLTHQPMHEWGSNNRMIIVINDKSEFREEQYNILKNYEVVTYDGGTADFIGELSQQWKKRSPEFEKPKSVFLSYTRADSQAVENLKNSLEKINNVNCWYDKHDLEPGDNWRGEIVTHIRKADLFIPLISKNSLEHEDGYVQKEWLQGTAEWAYRIQEKIDGKYLIPIVIDGSKKYSDAVQKHFDSSINIVEVPDGNPEPTFLEEIKKILNLA